MNFNQKYLGYYLPGDLIVRLNCNSEDIWIKETSQINKKVLFNSRTLRHELHHYTTMTGTGWGAVFTRYMRSWVSIGFQTLVNQIIPYFKNKNKLIPFPITKYMKVTENKEDKDFLAKTLFQFIINTQSLYLENGMINSFNGIHLPIIKKGNDAFAYGNRDIIECIARLEDRLWLKDYNYEIYPFQKDYDLIFAYNMVELGLTHPLYTLFACDIALNNPYPLKNGDKLESLDDRFPPFRLCDIMQHLVDLKSENKLMKLPDGVKGLKRIEIDKYYLEFQNLICDKFNWKTPVQILRNYLNSDEWKLQGIRKEHLKTAIELRESYPSIYAFQYLDDVTNDFSLKIQPNAYVFNNGVLTTLTDPETITYENIFRARKAVVEQIICERHPNVFECPLCYRNLLFHKHTEKCGGNIYFEQSGFNFNQFFNINSMN